MKLDRWTPGPYPPLTLSHSAIERLGECPRKHYWAVYGSWRGWMTADEVSSEARLAYALKKLSSGDQILGTLVHKEAKRCVLALRDGRRLPTAEEVEMRLERALGRVFQFRPSRYQHLRRPKAVAMLRSAFYRDGVPDIGEVERVTRKLSRCAHNLVISDVWEELRQVPKQGFRSIDKPGTMDLDMDGQTLTVHVTSDLIVQKDTGETLIVDWKTSQDLDVREQLQLYALYAARGLGLPWAEDCWEVRAVSLVTRDEDGWIIDEEDLQAAEDRLRTAARRMQALIEDSSTGKPRAREAFDLAVPRRRILCSWCPYHLLCRDELQQEAERAAS
jgi:hypothetical protein